MKGNGWRVSPVLGVRHVRKAAEYYRDVLGFSLDPAHGVFQPTADEPGGVYAIVKRFGVWRVRAVAWCSGNRIGLSQVFSYE